MTKKSNYLLSLFGALLLTSSLQAQSLLPKPQQVTMGKGVFSTAGGVKVENQVGADAENIYTKAWNAKVNDAAYRDGGRTLSTRTARRGATPNTP